ncbi:hypothetical protein M5K25_012351 [Dendrobium thyrsiflorum]|uniref:Uncharacterized protein n=1 Tax=Dendrobium thyrsiflorum TaxID=117978 RepID=A0ABD0UWT2_DENTH
MVFAIAFGGLIRMFNARKFEKGPFDTYSVGVDKSEANVPKFSSDGRLMLLTTMDGHIHILDSFRGSGDGSVYAWSMNWASIKTFFVSFAFDLKVGLEKGGIMEFVYVSRVEKCKSGKKLPGCLPPLPRAAAAKAALASPPASLPECAARQPAHALHVAARAASCPPARPPARPPNLPVGAYPTPVGFELETCI